MYKFSTKPGSICKVHCGNRLMVAYHTEYGRLPFTMSKMVTGYMVTYHVAALPLWVQICRVEQGRNFAKFKAWQSPWTAWCFSTTTLYPQLHVTSILSPLHALNHWPHVEATYYCMFLLVSHISQSWLSGATLLHPQWHPGSPSNLLEDIQSA